MKIFPFLERLFSTSSEAHGWIPQDFLIVQTKMYMVLCYEILNGCKRGRKTHDVASKKFPVLYVVFPSYCVNNAMLTIDVRKRERKLITFKSMYGAIIACLNARYARYAANYKRNV